MSNETRYHIVEVKALEDERGTFTGDLSTYGNVDRTGDIVEAGAYDDDIKANGSKRPLLWQHDTHEPIGSLQIVSTNGSLRIEGHINTETAKGKDAYALLKGGDIDGLSIGYTVDNAHFDEQGVRHLDRITLLEGSVVTFPADELARIDSVKEDPAAAQPAADAPGQTSGSEPAQTATEAGDGQPVSDTAEAEEPANTEPKDPDADAQDGDADDLGARIHAAVEEVRRLLDSNKDIPDKE